MEARHDRSIYLGILRESFSRYMMKLMREKGDKDHGSKLEKSVHGIGQIFYGSKLEKSVCVCDRA